MADTPSDVVADVVLGKEIDYRAKTYENGSYAFTKLLPVQGPLNPSLSASNETIVTIEWPAKVINPARSKLRFQLKIPLQVARTGTATTGTALTVWVHAEGLSVISRISLFTRGGVYLVDLSNFGTFSKMVSRWTQSPQELASNDVGELGTWGTSYTTNLTQTNGFQRCNSRALNLPQAKGTKRANQNFQRLGVVDADVNVTKPGVLAALSIVDGGVLANTVQSGINMAIQQANFNESGNQLATASLTNADTTSRTGWIGSVDEIEPRYLMGIGARGYNMGAATVATQFTTANYCVNLGQIPHCLFAMDKDLYFGETLVLQINFAPLNRIGFQGLGASVLAGSGVDDNVVHQLVEYHPSQELVGTSAGMGSTLTTGGALAAGGTYALVAQPDNADNVASLRDVHFLLAVETNPVVRSSVIDQMARVGLRLICPYVYSNKYTSSGTNTTQNVQQRLNFAWGRKLKRVYSSPFHLTETNHNAYNNVNVGGTETVSSFYTTMDNDRIQEQNIDCTKGDDYVWSQPLIKGTSIFSREHFQKNWVWVDDWTGLSPVRYRETDFGDCGLSLAQERLWQAFFTTRAADFNHYSFFVTEKMLSITPGQITIL